MKTLTKFVLLAGIITFIVGFTYSFFIAGIPYQDPTPELLEKYNRNNKTGELLLMTGLRLTGFAGILFISGWLFKKAQ